MQVMCTGAIMPHVGMVVYVAQDPTELLAWSKDTIQQKDSGVGSLTGQCPVNNSSRCTKTKDGLQGVPYATSMVGCQMHWSLALVRHMLHNCMMGIGPMPMTWLNAPESGQRIHI